MTQPTSVHSNKVSSSLNQPSPQAIVTDKAVRTMADAIFKHLQDEGCQAKDIINVSSQLLGLVTTQLSSSDEV